MPRIIVALSGGVDSAVTALILKEEGWEPIGVHLRLWDSDPDDPACALEGVCGGDQAADDARAVASSLGMPFYVYDLREAFTREVAEMTIAAYARATTPNPCIACNHKVRIPGLLRLAESLGVEAVATGHYVRKESIGGKWFLAEGDDPRRDQSYALYRLGSSDLARLEFPLGDLDKSAVRERARQAGIGVANKASSVDLCFAKSAGGIGKLVAERRPETGQPGPLVDEAGQVIGRHPGIAYITIGQRGGLSWNRTTPERRYVSQIDGDNGRVVVAPRERLLTASTSLLDPIRHDDSIELPPLEARIRYQGERYPVRWEIETGRVRFIEAGPPLAAGQAVVLYAGHRVIGGGTAVDIERAQSDELAAGSMC